MWSNGINELRLTMPIARKIKMAATASTPNLSHKYVNILKREFFFINYKNYSIHMENMRIVITISTKENSRGEPALSEYRSLNPILFLSLGWAM
jgi:hypothetical protein